MMAIKVCSQCPANTILTFSHETMPSSLLPPQKPIPSEPYPPKISIQTGVGSWKKTWINHWHASKLRATTAFPAAAYPTAPSIEKYTSGWMLTCHNIHPIASTQCQVLFPQTIPSVSLFTNLLDRFRFSDKCTDEAHTSLKPLQVPNAAKGSSSWQNTIPWPGESSVNLCPPTYTPRRSYAGTHSHHSDSAWETIPSTPSTDDFDMRPMPDDNSASMQSYNHPRTGIWEVQENTYDRHTTRSSTGSIRPGDGIDPPKVQSLLQNFQQVFDNADAATPFGTEHHFKGEALLVDAALGGYQRPYTALSTPSITRCLEPQLNRAPLGGRSGISIQINDATDIGAFSIQQPPEVEQYLNPFGSDQSLLQGCAPRFMLDYSPLPASSLTSAVLMDPPVPLPTPSTSADTSTTGVAKCPYRGCSARYQGKKRMDTLRRHKRLEHSNRPKPVCPVCKLVFQSGRPDNVKRHFQDKHPSHPLPAWLNVRKMRSVPSQRYP